MLGSREGLATQLTRIHFDFLGAGVPVLYVLRHRVEPHELLVADVAVELLRFVLALRLKVLVERIRVGKRFAARYALVDEALQLVKMLQHHVIKRLPAALEGLRAECACVEFLWNRVGVERELYSIIRWTGFVLILTLGVAQEHLVTVLRKDLIKLLAVVLRQAVAQVAVQLRRTRLFQVDVERIKEKYFVLDLDIVEGRRHEMLVEVSAQRRYPLEFLIANLADCGEVGRSLRSLTLERLLHVLVHLIFVLLSQMIFVVGARHESLIAIFTVDRSFVYE